MKLRIAAALDAKALILGEVPVQDVELQRRHAVEVSFEDLRRNPMTRHVDQQPAPGEARAIVDPDGGDAKLGLAGFHQLQERLEPAQHPVRRRGAQARRFRRHLQLVRLVFDGRLYVTRRPLAVDEQSGRAGRPAHPQVHSRLPGQPCHHPGDGALQPRFRITDEFCSEARVDREVSLAEAQRGRDGHQSVPPRLDARHCRLGLHPRPGWAGGTPHAEREGQAHGPRQGRPCHVPR